MTQGRVVGTDISAGMIVQAQDKYRAIEFRKLAAESLDYQEEFDVVFAFCGCSVNTEPGAYWCRGRDAGRGRFDTLPRARKTNLPNATSNASIITNHRKPTSSCWPVPVAPIHGTEIHAMTKNRRPGENANLAGTVVADPANVLNPMVCHPVERLRPCQGQISVIPLSLPT